MDPGYFTSHIAIKYEYPLLTDAVTSLPSPSTASTSNYESVPDDISSRQGKFGWTFIGDECIPYIKRRGESFCALRIIQRNIMSKYFTGLHCDVYKCTPVKCYYISMWEAELLTEINNQHSDFSYGPDCFTINDLVISLYDAKELYKFLSVCYSVLLNPYEYSPAECGFIYIDSDTVVCYVMRNNQRFVPTLYLCELPEFLRNDTILLDKWELAYVKLCCRIQGIRTEAINSYAVNFSSLQLCFTPTSELKEVWPSEAAFKFVIGIGGASP